MPSQPKKSFEENAASSSRQTSLPTSHAADVGLSGFLEAILRRFKVLSQAILMMPLYGVGILCLGLSLTPSVLVFQWGMGHWGSSQLGSQHPILYSVQLSLMIALGYVLFGFCIILVVPLFNFLLRTYPKPWRGPYHSLPAIRWGIHNALTYLPRYLFLEYMTPSPFSILFYKLMGMKIGRDVQLNTTNISDPCLIEIGDRVTIGGNATLIAHYAQGGYLVIAPVKIGNGSTIGLRAIIMGDVIIGEKVKILSNSLVLPKTRIPSGETWGGVPASKIEFLTKRR